MLYCSEGKDRAGFASALMGASAGEIAADYMQSYENDYHIAPAADAEGCGLIMDGNIMEMLRYIAGPGKGESLEGVDLAKAAEEYLLSRDTAQASIEKLKENLSA